MDISFKCPNCQQELEVDAAGAGSSIECPACQSAITVPVPEQTGAPPVAEEKPAAAPVKVERHFSVPVHEKLTEEPLIQKPNRPLDVVAKDGDKTMRIKSFKRSDCQEVGRDRFDELVSAFLEKVGQTNIVSVNPITYSYMELGSRMILADYGVMIVYKG
jgi:DNA-directed RNA polymerase subunit RPC12/RpoP